MQIDGLFIAKSVKAILEPVLRKSLGVHPNMESEAMFQKHLDLIAETLAPRIEDFGSERWNDGESQGYNCGWQSAKD